MRETTRPVDPRMFTMRLCPAVCAHIQDVGGRGVAVEHQPLMASRLRQNAGWEEIMPEQATLERARRDKRAGKAPSTQAGEFVREEIHHVREGKHGASSTKQAIAIGLSTARR